MVRVFAVKILVNDGNKFFEHAFCFFYGDVPAYKHGKFIAAQPARNVFISVEIVLQNGGKFPQNLIAHGMTQLVVYQLEIIHIQNHKNALSRSVCKRQTHELFKALPVEKLGQRIHSGFCAD